MNLFCGAVLLALFAALPGKAGISVMANITIEVSNSEVELYQWAEADSNLATWYDVGLRGHIYRNGNLVTCSNNCASSLADGNPTASLTVTTSKVTNSEYAGLSQYYAIAYFSQAVNGYNDPVGFAGFAPVSNTGDDYVFNGSGVSYVLSQEAIHLGDSWVGDDTKPPVITGINVTGSPVRGGSGYVEVYGTNLRQYAGITSSSMSGSGVTTSVIYQNPANAGQVNLSYSIASNASTGSRSLTLTTPDGSDSTTFTVGDPSPQINAIVPYQTSGFESGETTIFTIWGLWFGSNPQVSVTGNGITSFGTSYKSDTQINAWVAIDPSTPNGTATVTVTSNGYTGSGFQSVPGGGGTQDATTIQVQAATPTLTCPSSVQRGSSINCTVSGIPASSVTSWKFQTGGTTVNGPTQQLTWGGVMVQGGTITVSTNGAVSAAKSVTVTARSWTTAPASASQMSNGTFYTLGTPPTPSGSFSDLGISNYVISWNGFSAQTVGSGPNSGYHYFGTPLTYPSSFRYEYIINPDLENQVSTFSQHQCGGSTQFISWSNLKANTIRHESAAHESHWENYSNSLAKPTNNLGVLFESAIGQPNTSVSGFESNTSNTLSDAVGRVAADAAVEPAAVNENASGTFLGDINYAPYTACP